MDPRIDELRSLLREDPGSRRFFQLGEILRKENDLTGAEEVLRLGLRHRRMPSGAGHDAQSFADVCPSGMIFIPSVEGRSHGPDEHSHWEDCVNGANLLLHAALEVAETYRHTRTK